MKPKPLAFLKSIPHAYATVMFSDHLGVGLALMLLTLVSPVVGLAGLAGLIIGLLSSRILGFEGWESSSGVLGFNSLLIGLTL
ncbi:MAG TPA: urea transporter, partial [Candidatus Cloacimonadota bacterium]|nr:urea transporter [Candidatus Cloacimonadota bacterium]